VSNTYIEILKWIEKYHEGDSNVTAYRGLERSKEFASDLKWGAGTKIAIDPMLPVDIVVVEKKKEPRRWQKRTIWYYYRIFWIITELPNDEEIKDLMDKLSFYQFYLSLLCEPMRMWIIVVVPPGLGEIRALKREIAKHRFGLWDVDNTRDEPKEIIKPLCLRDRMVDDIMKRSKKAGEEGKGIIKAHPSNGRKVLFFEREVNKDKAEKMAKDLAIFFDQYVMNAVEAWAGRTPEQIGKRNIERNVLDLAYNLENISYNGDLVSKVVRFLYKKGSEDDLVSGTFSSLWKKYLSEDYSKILKQFDTILAEISNITGGKPYRDHYLHQFQVFLIGLDIINKFYEDFKKLWTNYMLKQGVEGDKIQPIENAWLVAASFHDMAYPLQLYEKWARSFFGDILGVKNMGNWDLKTKFIGETFLASMGVLITFFCRAYKGEVPANWPEEEKELVNFFYEKITEEKIHSVLSSIALLKGVKKNRKLIDSIYAPAALAIALHDNSIWESKNSRKAKEKGLQDGYLEKLKCEEDPLSFLLLFCDNAQEFGRKEKEEKFILDDIKCKVTGKKSYKVILWSPNLSGDERLFKKKMRELEALRSFLRQPIGDVKIAFEIDLLEANKQRKHPYPMED